MPDPARGLGPRPVQWKGEPVTADQAMAALFFKMVIPNSIGGGWSLFMIDKGPRVQAEANQFRNHGQECFWFYLPGQLADGIPLDTRLR